MSEQVRSLLRRALPAFALGLGLLGVLLGITGLSGQLTLGAGLLAGGILLLSLCAMKRWSRVLLGVVAVGGLAVWMTMLGGWRITRQVGIALWLEMQSVPGALPLFGREIAIGLSLLLALLCWASAGDGSGPFLGLGMTMLAGLALWITDRSDLMPWLLPSVCACVVLLALYRARPRQTVAITAWAVALCLLAWALTPAGGLTLQPLKDIADNLRQRLMDTLFYTAPRDVFSLAAEGYYPQGLGQLGGPASPTDHPVMEVNCSKQVYLRGAIRNNYTGRAWTDTTGGRRYLWQSLQWESTRRSVFGMDLPAEALRSSSPLSAETVTVRMLSDSATTLFVPQRIQSLTVGGDMTPYFNLGSEIFGTRNLVSGDSYTAVAALPISGDAGLETLLMACAAQDDPAWNQIESLYTDLPRHLEEPVWALMLEATQGAETPYQKAFAIQSWLSRNYRYTLDAAEQPANLDFVTNFLLNTREGYCTYFASAMTVLCRMAGLPARYVEGYLAQPNEEGYALVTGLDGHAWTEVYFAGFGWLTFDATPGRQGQARRGASGSETPTQEPDELPTPETSESYTTPTPEPQSEPSPEPTEEPAEPDSTEEPEPEAEPEPAPADSASFPWWLLAVLAALAALVLRFRRTRPEACARRAKKDQARWEVWAQALCDVLYVQGIRRRPEETLHAFLYRVSPQLTTAAQSAAEVLYAPRGADAEDVRVLREAAEAAQRALTGTQKARFACRRAFVPLKRRSYTL